MKEKKPPFLQLVLAAIPLALIGAASIGISRHAHAVRFPSEDLGDGSGPVVVYPGSRITLQGRGDEVLAEAKSAPLAALPVFLSQFGSVTGGQGTPVKNPREKAIALLDRAADLLVAQAPAELQLPLRNAYLNGESVVYSTELWNNFAGRRLAQGHYYALDRFSIEVADEVREAPILMKFYRLLGVMEVAQSAAILKRHPDVPYRHVYPVLNIVNRITGWLMAEELLSKIDPWVIAHELATMSQPSAQDSELDAMMKITVATAIHHDLDLTKFLDRQVSEAMSMNHELREAGLVEWVETIRKLREEKARALGNGSALLASLAQRLRVELGSQDSQNWFKTANRARASGDELLGRVVRDLIRDPLSCEEAFF